MKEGDLCYIPQAVNLFNKEEHPCVIITQKPMSAIYLREYGKDHTCAMLWSAAAKWWPISDMSILWRNNVDKTH